MLHIKFECVRRHLIRLAQWDISTDRTAPLGETGNRDAEILGQARALSRNVQLRMPRLEATKVIDLTAQCMPPIGKIQHMTYETFQPIDAAVVPRFAGLPTFMRLPHVPSAAGLDVALADFRGDVLAAADLARDMTIAIRKIGDPARAPWPPMRTGKHRDS